LGVLYGIPPSPGNYNSSLALRIDLEAMGTWSIAIGNEVLASADSSLLSNVAIGSFDLWSLTMGGYNTALGQGSLSNLSTGSSNVGLGYEVGGGYLSSDGFQTGSNNIAIGNLAASGTNDAACSNNIYIGPGAVTSAVRVSNSIILGSRATSGVSNEFLISNINHLNIPSLTTSADGTGTLLQWGRANTGWVQASGGTYNTVSKIDTELSSLGSSVSALLSGGTLFTTSGSYTVPSNVTTITIEPMGGGGGGAGSGSGSAGAWDGGGGGSLGLLKKITIPVTSGQVISFTIGAGGTAGSATSISSGNRGTTTITMYGHYNYINCWWRSWKYWH